NAGAREFISAVGREKLKKDAITLTFQIKVDAVLAGDLSVPPCLRGRFPSVEIATAQKEATGLANHLAAGFAHL
ncbi:MAG TPA: hypothetical protein VKU42_11160, partial [Candidatus Angelobacter sp.]|nr:hypothetical protein [Candidatus Angelobacter sp.]